MKVYPGPRRGGATCAGARGGQGCIRREGTSEAVGGGCRSGWGRLLSVTNAIGAGIWRQGDSGSATWRGGGGPLAPPPSNASLAGQGAHVGGVDPQRAREASLPIRRRNSRRFLWRLLSRLFLSSQRHRTRTLTVPDRRSRTDPRGCALERQCQRPAAVRGPSGGLVRGLQFLFSAAGVGGGGAWKVLLRGVGRRSAHTQRPVSGAPMAPQHMFGGRDRLCAFVPTVVCGCVGGGGRRSSLHSGRTKGGLLSSSVDVHISFPWQTAPPPLPKQREGLGGGGAGMHSKRRSLRGGPKGGLAGGWRRLPERLGAVTVDYTCH